MMTNSITISKYVKILNNLQTKSIFVQMQCKVFHRSIPNQNYDLIIKNICLNKVDKNTPNSHSPNQKPNEKPNVIIETYNITIIINNHYDILITNEVIVCNQMAMQREFIRRTRKGKQIMILPQNNPNCFAEIDTLFSELCYYIAFDFVFILYINRPK